MRKNRWLALLLGPALLAAAATGASAQAYPNKPVRLILPYSPGGVVDYVGRQIGQHLGDAIGQPVVAENRPGAGGINGTDATARSAPDGYTLLLMDPAIVINPTLQASVPYNLFKDLQVVSVVSSSPLVLVTSPQTKVKTVDELIAYGKANPGKLNFASAGIGTTPHLSGEFLQQRAGIAATHIPYKSIGQSYPDMMANKIHFSFSSIAGALPFTTDNRVTAIATTGAKRSPVFANLPTVEEAGQKGFVVDLWLGVFAPAGVPADVVAKLNEGLTSILKKPELIKALAKVGVEPNGTSASAGQAFVKAEFEKWKKVIEDGKIKSN
jgi:tripartite-type tricarboxylate transporter receptor subunit TctC